MNHKEIAVKHINICSIMLDNVAEDIVTASTQNDLVGCIDIVDAAISQLQRAKCNLVSQRLFQNVSSTTNTKEM
jgi:hypothetical protein